MAGTRGGSGFTLLELIIVIGILVALMGLTVGVWMRTGGGNAILGAEHLVVDAIRQARHTARSSGGPVVLVFDRTANELRGVSRFPLWQEGFDRFDPTDTRVHPGGRTGNAAAPGTWDTATWSDPAITRPIDPLPRLNRLERPGRGDGWILSAAVLPPRPQVGTSTILPVIAVAQSGSQRLEDSAAGLLLVAYDYLIQRGRDDESRDVRTAVWQVVGWRTDPAGTRTVLTSHMSTPVAGGIGATAGDVTDDVAGPISGGRWIDLALVWDGTALSLQRDGRPLAARAIQETATFPEPFSPVVLIGRLDVARPDDGPDLRTAQGTFLDDAAIWRLGSDLPALFPRGVELGSDARMVVRPDGTVSGSTSVLVRQTAGGRSATITVNAAGVVTSAIQESP
ncbi:MAG: hypothetical protein RLZZ127_554 [Planctomycetota bacterium]|jgi:type II secretory pathway pseudopilin PulG